MNGTDNNGNCRVICWGIGVVAGLVAFAVMRPGVMFLLALILAVVIGFAVGYVLISFVCKAQDSGATMGAGAATATGSAAQSSTASDTQSADAVSAPKAAAAPVTPPPAPATPAPATPAPATPAPATPDQATPPQAAAAAQAGTTDDAASTATAKAASNEAASNEAATPPAKEPAKAPAKKAAKTPASATNAASAGDAAKPKGLAAARAGGADDLKLIKGVGPALEKMLNDLGFYHFDQIASWSDHEIAWVDQNLKGFKGRATRDNWIAQAKDLASGA